MLRYDPAARITAKDLLAHEFFQETARRFGPNPVSRSSGQKGSQIVWAESAGKCQVSGQSGEAISMTRSRRTHHRQGSPRARVLPRDGSSFRTEHCGQPATASEAGRRSCRSNVETDRFAAPPGATCASRGEGLGTGGSRTTISRYHRSRNRRSLSRVTPGLSRHLRSEYRRALGHGADRLPIQGSRYEGRRHRIEPSVGRGIRRCSRSQYSPFTFDPARPSAGTTVRATAGRCRESLPDCRGISKLQIQRRN
jgi:hypothetical protein